MLPSVTRFQTVAGSRAQLSRNICMFNFLDIQPLLVIKVPAYVAQNYHISEVLCCEDSTDITDSCTMSDGYPWIDVQSESLDTTPGTHTYRVKFTSEYSTDILYMYFGYIIQKDDPDKPYIYMKENET